MLFSACATTGTPLGETTAASPTVTPTEVATTSAPISGILTGSYRMAIPRVESSPVSPSEAPQTLPVAEKEDDLDKAEDDLTELKEYTGTVDSRGFEFTTPTALYSPGNLNQASPGQVLQTWTTNKDNPEAADAIIVLAQVKDTDATDAWGSIKEFPDAGGQGGTRNISNLVVPGADSAIEIETPGDNEESRARTILAYKDGKAYLLGASGFKESWEAKGVDKIFSSFQIEQ